MSNQSILVLFYSKYGSTYAMAKEIALGIESVGCSAVLRTIPEVASVTTVASPAIPESGALYCTAEDLTHCAGLALGSPTRFGNMAAPMKHFWDQTSNVWLAGHLQGKPACVFTASGSMHGGQESTLFSMMIPLLHHGMYLMGLPYSEPALSNTTRGGTPYGASYVTGTSHNASMSLDEKTLCFAQGKRLAMLVQQLAK